MCVGEFAKGELKPTAPAAPGSDRRLTPEPSIADSLDRRAGARLRAEARDVPVRNRRPAAARPARAVRSHRHRPGARYRFGLGAPAAFLLDLGLARWPPLRSLFSSPRLRDWFYVRARRGTAQEFRGLARPGQAIVAIGDAAKAGKSKRRSPARSRPLCWGMGIGKAEPQPAPSPLVGEGCGRGLDA